MGNGLNPEYLIVHHETEETGIVVDKRLEAMDVFFHVCLSFKY